MSDDSGSHTFLAFVVGAAAGAALALLYAPRTGPETRDIVNEKVRQGREKGKEFKDKARVRAREIMDDAGTYVEKGRAHLQSRRERFHAAVDAGREAYRDEKDRES
ncbi:MAG TPA: YtxH domain-containing protein [Vicinamibacteria bacterium]|jgi:gas vesicle protein